MNAIDTNVLAYAVDQNEPVKRQKARALLVQLASVSAKPILLWQVAVEFVACLKRWEQRSILSSAETLANWQLAEMNSRLCSPGRISFPQRSTFSSGTACPIGTPCSSQRASRLAWTPSIPKIYPLESPTTQ